MNEVKKQISQYGSSGWQDENGVQWYTKPPVQFDGDSILTLIGVVTVAAIAGTTITLSVLLCN